jgi:chromosomal replication initiator protein
MDETVWREVRSLLRDTVGEHNDITWLSPLRLIGIDEGVANLSAPTNFIGNWVSRNFADHVLRAFQAAGHGVRRVDICVDLRHPRRAMTRFSAPSPALRRTEGAPRSRSARPSRATADEESAGLCP